MIHQPDVLFLDEPTTGLDPQNRANLWDQIRKLRANGTTIFLTTHYLEEADELADRPVGDKIIILAKDAGNTPGTGLGNLRINYAITVLGFIHTTAQGSKFSDIWSRPGT